MGCLELHKPTNRSVVACAGAKAAGPEKTQHDRERQQETQGKRIINSPSLLPFLSFQFETS